jgi:2-succinyl-5-enolpyruvyl-6-hydroxy-3-cyclohexene-1-carboxylate synthase
MQIQAEKDINNLYKKDVQLARQVLQELIACGIKEICICPAARNSLFVYLLANSTDLPIQVYSWPEERSCAFFALGRIKAMSSPVAVIVTSGTAAGELLPAAIEAFYTGLPLVLVTADRPKRFRLTGAPQSVEQIGLYSHYVSETQDLEGDQRCFLHKWDQLRPIHLNICLEENKDENREIVLTKNEIYYYPDNIYKKKFCKEEINTNYKKYEAFISKVICPFIVVSALSVESREAVVRYLQFLGAPVYLEASSGIREDERLRELRMECMDSIWETARKNGYEIDGMIRLGGIPTVRFWRDLENEATRVPVCSISELPFSGLSFADLICVESIAGFLQGIESISAKQFRCFGKWKKQDDEYREFLLSLYDEEPRAEESLIHGLSKLIPMRSKVYLGNSLPIREWDSGATREQKGFEIGCNRGANGIDGQIATFLGFCSREQENWGIFGDLTVLYDLVAPWILPQLDFDVNIVVVNNAGGQIFAPMFKHRAFLNHHTLSFECFAEFWKCAYEKWTTIPELIAPLQQSRIIELIPDETATQRFYEKKKGGMR